jgi:hypothetical protein
MVKIGTYLVVLAALITLASATSQDVKEVSVADLTDALTPLLESSIEEICKYATAVTPGVGILYSLGSCYGDYL